MITYCCTFEGNIVYVLASNCEEALVKVREEYRKTHPDYKG